MANGSTVDLDRVSAPTHQLPPLPTAAHHHCIQHRDVQSEHGRGGGLLHHKGTGSKVGDILHVYGS